MGLAVAIYLEASHHTASSHDEHGKRNVRAAIWARLYAEPGSLLARYEPCVEVRVHTPGSAIDQAKESISLAVGPSSPAYKLSCGLPLEQATERGLKRVILRPTIVTCSTVDSCTVVRSALDYKRRLLAQI